jgi:hypothetical protein
VFKVFGLVLRITLALSILSGELEPLPGLQRTKPEMIMARTREAAFVAVFIAFAIS